MSLPSWPWCGVRADRRSPMRIDSGFIEPFNFAAVGARQLTSRARVLEVRIQSPPADSPSLAGFLIPVSKSGLLPRRARSRPGGTAGRDTQGPSTSRQLPVTSLSSLIPVPRCRRRGLGTVRHRSTASALLVTCRCWLGVAPDRAQAKPSTVRCSGQPSGRRECASSLSAVRSRGWPPSTMAWVISGAR
jgi:hypothetical protein